MAKEISDLAARRWYVKYPLDAYALGPYEFKNPVTADVAVEEAKNQFGELPAEVWPDGPTVSTDEYEYEVAN